MGKKIEYVRRKWLQVVIPLAIVDIGAGLYVLYTLAAPTWSSNTNIDHDLFKFCLMILAFSVPFLGFLWLVRAFVISAISNGDIDNS